MKPKKDQVISLLEESDCFRLTLSFKIANPCKPYFKKASREINTAFNYANEKTYLYTRNEFYTEIYDRYVEEYQEKHLFKDYLVRKAVTKPKDKKSRLAYQLAKEHNATIDSFSKKELKAKNKAIQEHNRKLYAEIKKKTLQELGWKYLPTLSEFDLNKLTTGCTKPHKDKDIEKLIFETKDKTFSQAIEKLYGDFSCVNIAMIQQVNKELITRKKQFKRLKLCYRRSYGSGKSLAWIPFKQENLSTWINGNRFSGRNAKTPDFNKTQQIFTYYQAFLDNKNTGLSPDNNQFTKPSIKGLVEFYRINFLENKEGLNNPAFNKQHSLYTKHKKTNVLLKLNNKKIRIRNQDTLIYYLTCLGAEVKSGSINQDSLDDWYINLSVKVDKETYQKYHLAFMQHIEKNIPFNMVGIDPGQKTLLTCIDNHDIATQYKGKKFYTQSQEELLNKQKRKLSKQTKRLHRRIKRQRKHHHEKIANDLIKKNTIIKIGDLSSAFLNKSNKAKASYDLGLGQLKMILNHKCHRAGRLFLVVPEKYSTQRCSHCKALTGPSGNKGLNVRSWTCKSCKRIHDRDINAAKNIRDTLIIMYPEDYEYMVQLIGKVLPTFVNGDKNTSTVWNR